MRASLGRYFGWAAVETGAPVGRYRQVRSSRSYSVFEAIKIYHQTDRIVRRVRKWCREFTAGLTKIDDEQKSGRPSRSDEAVATMGEDRRVTLRSGS